MSKNQKYIWDHVVEKIGCRLDWREIEVAPDGVVLEERFTLDRFRGPPNFEYIEAAIVDFYELFPSSRPISQILVDPNDKIGGAIVSIRYEPLARSS